jgi:succinyl-CoA synthetase beta subunit
MKIHEYQAKALFREYQIPVPKSRVARTASEALHAGHDLDSFPLVVKAQIHAGGRGKGGGIRVVRNLDELEETAANLLGSLLVTPQIGGSGKPVHTILIEEAIEATKEFYLGITIDRSRACPIVLASAQGGMDIEKVAAESPEKVIQEMVHPAVGMRPFQANRLAYSLGLDSSNGRRVSGIALSLYRLFVDKDCSMAEINPLVTTDKGDVVALDGKITFDDNALFRHPETVALRDRTQEDPLEVEASKYNLNYIKLTGNVGCIVNGAGLAMATMDLTKLAGAEPANFLDVGGGATSEMVRQALRILLSDSDIRVVLANIFGGILRCDTFASGVVEAARELGLSRPMVIRLEGTNVEKGREILASSGLSLIVADSLKDAAEKVREVLARG